MLIIRFIKIVRNCWNLLFCWCLCCLWGNGNIGTYFGTAGGGVGSCTSTHPSSLSSIQWLPFYSSSPILGTIQGLGNAFPLVNSIVLHSFPFSSLGTQVLLGSFPPDLMFWALANCPIWLSKFFIDDCWDCSCCWFCMRCINSTFTYNFFSIVCCILFCVLAWSPSGACTCTKVEFELEAFSH